MSYIIRNSSNSIIKISGFNGQVIDEAEMDINGKKELLSEFTLIFHRNPDTGKLECSTGSNAKYLSDVKDIKESYPLLIKERDNKLINTKNRFERLKILKEYKLNIKEYEKYYIPKKERIESNLPSKVIEVRCTTPRKLIEDIILEKYGEDVPDDVTAEGIYNEIEKRLVGESYNGYKIINYMGVWDYLTKFECRVCGEIPALDEEIKIVYLDCYDMDYILDIPYCHKCAAGKDITVGRTLS